MGKLQFKFFAGQGNHPATAAESANDKYKEWLKDNVQDRIRIQTTEFQHAVVSAHQDAVSFARDASVAQYSTVISVGFTVDSDRGPNLDYIRGHRDGRAGMRIHRDTPTATPEPAVGATTRLSPLDAQGNLGNLVGRHVKLYNGNEVHIIGYWPEMRQMWIGVGENGPAVATSARVSCRVVLEKDIVEVLP